MVQRIFVPLDGSLTAERALLHAALLARLYGARMVLARVPESTVLPMMSGTLWVTEEVEAVDASEHAVAYLQEVAHRAEYADLDIDTITPPHPAAAGLMQAIHETGADLVVMTTHGYAGFKRWVFGSVADKIVSAAPVPVYLIREGAPTVEAPSFRRLLVPLDGSALSETALRTAADLAHRTRATLTLVQVPTVPGYVTGIPETAGWIPRYLRDQAAEGTLYLQDQASRLVASGVASDIDVEVVTAGTVADGILAAAEEHAVDLIVMSTHGRSGLGRWMFGSVADRVLRGAERPVWLVRAHEAQPSGT